MQELQFEVNQRLPESQKFDPLFWAVGKRMRLRRLQESVLPESPRFGKAVRFGVIGFCVFFSRGVVVVWVEWYLQALIVETVRRENALDFIGCNSRPANWFQKSVDFRINVPSDP